ncbi:MAG: glucose-1-phosphate cytidylyltransferase [Pseudomonadota bacterium]
MFDKSKIPVFLLCGGLGTRLKEETENIPKPMIPIGKRPILWHIMKSYSYHGFKKFVLCTGYKSEKIKDYFLNYSALNSDFTVSLKTNDISVHSIDHDEDWEVTLAFTGDLNMTGSRIKQAAKKYLGGAQHFAVSYGDGVTDADLTEEFDFHLTNNKIGTILGVNPPSRFGELKVEKNTVTEFAEKPDFKDSWINGGYMFFNREFLKYLSDEPDCVLERKPLINLAHDNQMNLYKHSGFWACMDTRRDYDQLNQIWESGKAPWKPKAFNLSALV